MSSVYSRRPKCVLLSLFFTAFLFFLGENIQQAPRTQIYESIICNQFNQPLTECKNNRVQEELAFLKGTERLLGALPTILVIPWSIFAERYGRGTALKLALLGVCFEESWSYLICSYSAPIRLILWAPMFEVLGGGPAIITTMLHLIAAAVTTEEQRTTTFFVIRATGIAAALLAQIVSSFLMSRDVWLPWALGLLCIFLAVFAAPREPNPIDQRKVDGDASLRTEEERLSETNSTHLQNGSLDTTVADTIQSRLRELSKQMHTGLKMIFFNPPLIVLLSLSFLSQLGEDSLPMVLLLYISERYGWDFAQANYLWALGEAIQFICLIALLPYASRLLLARSGMNAYFTDYTIAVFSAMMLSLGAMLLGLGFSISGTVIGVILMSTAGGLQAALRSLVTMVITPENLGVVYSVFTVLHVMSTSLAGPIYSSVFTFGLRFGIEYTGFPFVLAAILAALTLPTFLAIRPRQDYELVPEPGFGTL
ncbi:MFS transporter [Aspergillus saccharolyticus JOP 1030-1]|uniref:MFS general substrate transporter n=1 Tax=Aspergillus saccharolyticus JOP 1030-1 TaxID=1450539 RepID=A0A318ZKT0_9EURO|nr:MFS general substrate transporter [Aspergillus saccharolyticus JOP 1030-1]PYH48179.1 MFS general substrate transporter [Aspergillus saccharolyticus JOP 1030-1]